MSYRFDYDDIKRYEIIHLNDECEDDIIRIFYKDDTSEDIPYSNIDRAILDGNLLELAKEYLEDNEYIYDSSNRMVKLYNWAIPFYYLCDITLFSLSLSGAGKGRFDIPFLVMLASTIYNLHRRKEYKDRLDEYKKIKIFLENDEIFYDEAVKQSK